MELVTSKKSHPVRLGLLVFALAILGIVYWGQRSQRLSDALIQSVVDHDPRRAHDLLESGADPNSRLFGLGPPQSPATLWERILKLLRSIGGQEPPRGRPVLYQAIVSEQT